MGADAAGAIAQDAAGAMTVCGNTASPDFPATSGTYDTSYNGGAHDAFVTCLDLGITIGISQPQGPGTPITIDNTGLIPGNEYYNIFSLDAICVDIIGGVLGSYSPVTRITTQ